MKQVTVERSHIAARSIKPFAMKDVSKFRDLERIGIGMDERSVQSMMEFAFASDAAQSPSLSPSIAVPVQFLQNWLPGFVEYLTAARKIDLITGITTAGNWEDEEVVQGVLENIGVATPYGDYTNVPLASWNPDFERRTVVRFEEGMKVGVLEEKRASAMRINSAEQKRKASGLALEIQRNLVGFNGYNGGNDRTYGILNDPSLGSYVTVANGASGSALWSSKTFLEITADLRGWFKALRSQSQDTIDPEITPITLAIATNAVDYLSVVSDYGISVRDWLDKTYKNTRVVSAPQFNTANGGVGVAYMFAERVDDTSSDDGRTLAQIVPAKFQVVGVQKLAKGYEEDYSNATAGVLVKRPYAVFRASGIC